MRRFLLVGMYLKTGTPNLAARFGSRHKEALKPSSNPLSNPLSNHQTLANTFIRQTATHDPKTIVKLCSLEAGDQLRPQTQQLRDHILHELPKVPVDILPGISRRCALGVPKYGAAENVSRQADGLRPDLNLDLPPPRVDFVAPLSDERLRTLGHPWEHVLQTHRKKPLTKAGYALATCWRVGFAFGW